MDPNANLKEQRQLAAEIIAKYERNGRVIAIDATRLAELVEALDQWITKGGFLPEAWRTGEVFDPVAKRWRRKL